jgi:uncharacterized protein (UPF0147 family)
MHSQTAACGNSEPSEFDGALNLVKKYVKNEKITKNMRKLMKKRKKILEKSRKIPKIYEKT